MKRIIAFLLCLVTLFGLIGCNAGSTQAPTETELGPEVVEKKDYSKWANIVHDPKTWYDEFMALPIANADMTTDELRQLCVDAFKANLSFHWTPNQEIVYTYELLDRYSDVVLPVGIAYSGLFYATGITNTSRGNIYKMLNYYDHETGVVDIEAMGGIDNVISNLSSACAAGAQQAWNRVSGTHGIQGMKYYCMYNSNIVPVGPYTYVESDYNYKFGSRTASNEVIAVNGEEVMYESLAQMLPADGLYSSSAWHVMMCSSVPKVVRDANGKVNPYMSSMLVCEQGAGGTKNDSYNQDQPNGVAIRILGTIDKEYTFYDLIKKGYIPFTLKEFIGEDPVESGKAWIGAVPEQVMENGKEISPSALTTKNLYTNYALCYIRVEVKNPAGETLCSFLPNLPTDPRNREIMLTDPQMVIRIKPYANNKNTVHFYAQLSNGEYLEAFNGILKG